MESTSAISRHEGAQLTGKGIDVHIDYRINKSQYVEVREERSHSAGDDVSVALVLYADQIMI